MAISADEYLAAYARRHSLSVEYLKARGVRVIDCRCGVQGCSGHQIDWTHDTVPEFGAKERR